MQVDSMSRAYTIQKIVFFCPSPPLFAILIAISDAYAAGTANVGVPPVSLLPVRRNTPRCGYCALRAGDPGLSAKKPKRAIPIAPPTIAASAMLNAGQ